MFFSLLFTSNFRRHAREWFTQERCTAALVCFYIPGRGGEDETRPATDIDRRIWSRAVVCSNRDISTAASCLGACHG